MRSEHLLHIKLLEWVEAFRIAKLEMQKDKEKIMDIHEYFLNEVTKIEEIYINGDLSNKVPHILNVSFNFIEESPSS